MRQRREECDARHVTRSRKPIIGGGQRQSSRCREAEVHGVIDGKVVASCEIDRVKGRREIDRNHVHRKFREKRTSNRQLRFVDPSASLTESQGVRDLQGPVRGWRDVTGPLR